MRFLVSLFSLALLLVAPAFADDDHPRPFDQNFDAMSVVDAAMAEALESDKRLLLILGANWCHDSRGLAHHFEDPELAGILEAGYVMRYVDVGWRDQNHDVMHRFGVAAIYGTPTVFVIDPETGALLNRGERNDWTSAASTPIEDARDYFSRWARQSTPAGGVVETSLIYQAMMIEIDLFEDEEATRLGRAYLDIGAWRELDAGDRPDGFDALEQEVESWRRRLPREVASLRSNARRLVVAELTELADGSSIDAETIARLDAANPDLDLDFERHESDVW